EAAGGAGAAMTLARRDIRADRRTWESLATTWSCLLSSSAARAPAWRGVLDARTVLDQGRRQGRGGGRIDAPARISIADDTVGSWPRRRTAATRRTATSTRRPPHRCIRAPARHCSPRPPPAPPT